MINKYILVLAMYLSSGTFLFYRRHAGFTIIIYFIIILFYVLNGKLKLKRNSSFSYLVYFLLISLFNYFVFNQNHLSDGRETIIICYVLFLIATYIVISNFDILEFKKIFLNVSFYFSIVGLIVFGACVVGFLNYKIIDDTKICMFQNLSWAIEEPRLAGMFWEPGAFQIVLLLCLVLYWDDIRKRRCSKSETFKLLLLSVTMLTTQSSWGYFCFAYYVFTIALCWEMKKYRIWKYIIILPTLLVGVYILLTSSVITDKLAQAENFRARTSLSVRVNDNLALLQMIKEEPIKGYGIATREFEKRSNELDNSTSSNGLLHMGATLGLIMLAIYVFYMYKAAKVLFSDNWKIVYPLLIFLHLAEVFYYFPLAYILIFHFKSYTTKDVLKINNI